MAAGGAASHCIGWDLFLIDLEQLVLDYEQLKASNFTTNYSLDETLLERFENAVQTLRNVLPHSIIHIQLLLYCQKYTQSPANVLGLYS